MVHLAVALHDLGPLASLLLEDESHLCGDAEVAHGDQHDLLEHGVFAQLV